VGTDGALVFLPTRTWTYPLYIKSPLDEVHWQSISCSAAGFCEAVTTEDHFIYFHERGRTPQLPLLCAQFACQGTRV
jgi:hypothetical protein